MNVFSKDAMSLSEVKEHLSEIENGKFGKWVPLKLKKGVSFESFDGVSSQMLSKMRPPNRCVRIDVSARIRGSECPTIAQEIDNFLVYFETSSQAIPQYTVTLVGDGMRGRIVVDLPSASSQSGKTRLLFKSISPEKREAVFALFDLHEFEQPAPSLIPRVPDNTGVDLKIEGDKHIQLRFADPVRSFNHFVESLKNSKLKSDLFALIFQVGVGSLDTDEEMSPENVETLYADIANGSKIQRFKLGVSRAFESNWDVRESLRKARKGGGDYLDQLGCLTGSDGDKLDLALMYGCEGYRIAISGIEDIAEESSLFTFCNQLNLEV